MTCNKYFCEVCGYPSEEPWDYGEICPCCNAEVGYDYMDVERAGEYRERWIANGAAWHDEETRPFGWDYKEQLKNIAK